MIKGELVIALSVLAVVLASATPVQSPSGSGAERPELGRALFEVHCASCHGSDGRGADNGPPPLEDSSWVIGSETRLLKIVLHGMRGRIVVGGKTYNLEMPGFGKVLKDAEVAALATYVRRSRDPRRDSITEDSVRRVREAFRDRAEYWTAAELLQEP